ncbi:MAG: hypothetical protein ACK4N5_27755, partial [Myxococcales bacterium]
LGALVVRVVVKDGRRDPKDAVAISWRTPEPGAPDERVELARSAARPWDQLVEATLGAGTVRGRVIAAGPNAREVVYVFKFDDGHPLLSPSAPAVVDLCIEYLDEAGQPLPSRCESPENRWRFVLPERAAPAGR